MGDWFAVPGLLARFVEDLVHDELQQLRPAGGTVALRPWATDLRVDEGGLELDSLERLAIAGALAQALHLHESGIEDLLLARRHFGEWIDVCRLGLAHFSARLTFRTSGSAGTPKPCTHALIDLHEEVAHLGTLLADTRRVVCAVPAHHIYGFLFTVLLPARLGVSVVDARLVAPQALPRLLAPGDVLISHPAHWSMVARYASALPAEVTGVTSTAPCPPTLAGMLTSGKGGLRRLLQIYGSSETAGIGWREGPTEAYQLMPHWARHGADEATLTRTGSDGVARIIRLQDRLGWQSNRRFAVLGRIDGAVQVNGINVFPEHVRDVLLQHPGVADAAVRLMAPHETEGLKAYVVARAGVDVPALLGDLKSWMQARLPAPARPKSYRFGDALPVNALGKPCDWPLESVPVWRG
ncbi:MAG: 4-coumarate--CoA ligase [Pandoraea sp.]|nr:MAG: 4-coumarate--CoA ligase [Pandoraea sp.]TAM17536.1 MAG: 4-coumarate--CoA ligase [Pandoraea sp.]